MPPLSYDLFILTFIIILKIYLKTFVLQNIISEELQQREIQVHKQLISRMKISFFWKHKVADSVSMDKHDKRQ